MSLASFAYGGKMFIKLVLLFYIDQCNVFYETVKKS